MQEAKTNAMRMLEKAKIPYQMHTYEHEEGAVDGVLVAKRLGQDVTQVFKTLVTQGKSRAYYVFVIPVAEELDLKKAAKTVGEKSVEMIPVKEINAVTGYIRGGCSPVGMKKQFRTVIQESARSLATMYVSGGRIGLQIEVAPEALATLVRAEFADLVAVSEE
ncbi:MAG: Cys-tRNA(Pro) deacylase [Lachnospiraceae bacterium]